MELFILVFVGICGGVLVSGGVFALLTKVGIITRMIAVSKTADKTVYYERLIILGGTLGNIVSVFDTPLFGGSVLLIFYGTMSGVFTGCLSMALAESVNALPVFMRKLKLHTGLRWIVSAFALGKMMGSFLWFFK